MRIALVALEPSADVLAADFMKRLRAVRPDVEWIGVGGPCMAEQGLRSLYPFSDLSVMGLVEVIPALPRLLRIRSHLVRYFIQTQPDAVVGFDAPDFNLGLEARLKAAGLRTFHVVSPSVWAWRSGRVRKIKRAVDHLFALFPFELPIYQQHGISASVIGYPPMIQYPTLSQSEAREALGLPCKGRVLVILPGSRAQEIHQLGALFLDTAQTFCAQAGWDHTVLALSDRKGQEWFEKMPHFSNKASKITAVLGQTHTAILASDLVLACSGTVTLETLLLGRPLVVAYRLPALSWHLIKRLVSVSHIALPNLLAGFELVPECLQDRARIDVLVSTLSSLWSDEARRLVMLEHFRTLKETLQQGMDRWIPDFLNQLQKVGAA